MNTSKWARVVLVTLISLLALTAGTTFVIDPFFHYRKPSPPLRFYLGSNNERYNNDGILKHFDYDAIITGTSMTENFKTSEFDSLFGVESVKTSLSGATFKEIDESVERAVKANKKLKCVLRGLDTAMLAEDKDAMRYANYPEYLYDDDPYNDIYYLLNKNALMYDFINIVCTVTGKGISEIDFDRYENWNDGAQFGKELVLASRERKERTKTATSLSEAEKRTIRDNIRQNVVELADRCPQITFYLFFPPYSICYWDDINQQGKMKWRIEAERTAIESLIGHANIKLYSFNDEFDLICNLDYYKDAGHYRESVNSQILRWIHDGRHEITADNYQEYLRKIEAFYSGYDYDRIYE